MGKQNTRKKVPFCFSQSNDGSEIEKKVDEILNAHSEVLRRGRERKEPSENSLSFERKQQLLFFTKSKNKIEPIKLIKKENKPTKKHPQNQQKTRNKIKISKSHSEKLDSDVNIREKNVSLPQRNVINQKITSITKKILHPLSSSEHQHITIRNTFLSNKRIQTKKIRNKRKRARSEKTCKRI